tara:strand:+ start:607 stop:819 length:213 start_codon:yes stop_codon:yes gene_type:complete
VGIEVETYITPEGGYEVEFQTHNGTTIGVCRRDTEEEALSEIIAKCVFDVGRVKDEYTSFNINNDEVNGL